MFLRGSFWSVVPLGSDIWFRVWEPLTNSGVCHPRKKNPGSISSLAPLDFRSLPDSYFTKWLKLHQPTPWNCPFREVLDFSDNCHWLANEGAVSHYSFSKFARPPSALTLVCVWAENITRDAGRSTKKRDTLLVKALVTDMSCFGQETTALGDLVTLTTAQKVGSRICPKGPNLQTLKQKESGSTPETFFKCCVLGCPAHQLQFWSRFQQSNVSLSQQFESRSQKMNSGCRVN